MSHKRQKWQRIMVIKSILIFKKLKKTFERKLLQFLIDRKDIKCYSLAPKKKSFFLKSQETMIRARATIKWIKLSPALSASHMVAILSGASCGTSHPGTCSCAEKAVRDDLCVCAPAPRGRILAPDFGPTTMCPFWPLEIRGKRRRKKCRITFS